MAEELDNGQLVRPHRYCIANEVGKERQCNSSDALALYEHKLESGEIVYDAFCYSCNQRFSVEEVHKSSLAKDLGIEGGKVVEYKNFTKVPKNNPLSKQEVVDFIKQTGYSDKPYRGMLPEYLKFFGHLAKKDKDGKTIAFYYPETQEGAGVTGYKCRNLPKDFRYGKLGVTGLSCQLAGQVKFPKGGKYVLITAGECYHPDVETLTQRGWVKISDLSDTDLVMQVDNGVGSFTKPIALLKKEFEGDLLKYKGQQISQFVTPNHKMVSLNFKGEEYTHTAEEGPHSKSHSYRKAITIDCESSCTLTDDQLRFIVALSADAKVDTRKSGNKVAHFYFIKDRKIERLNSLIDKLGMKYTSYDKDYHGDYKNGKRYHTFNVQLEDWCFKKGLHIEWIETLNLRQRKLVLEEIILWDGNVCKGRNGFEFSSKLKSEADLIQILAVTSGYHASLRKRSNSLGEWYVVRVSTTKTTASWQLINNMVTKVPYSGFVYCVTVPTGKILTRYENKVMVCGNCDLVSAYQMLREDQKSRGQGEYDPVAVVSPTTGEPSAYKQVAAQYEFFDSFDIIVVGMDNDEVGKISAQAIAKVLPADKVRIATWSSKDPNKMLEEGKQKQFVRDFYNAKPYVNVGIKSASEAMSEVAEFLNAPKIKLPKHLHRLEENMRGGIKSTGAIVNIIGHTSIGKSLFTDTLIYDWVFNSPIVPTILSLERTAGELLIDLYSLHLKKNLTWFKDGNDALEYLDKPEVKVLCENLVYKEDGTPRFFIVDERSASVESMQKQIDKSRKQNSSNFIICDPLTDFLRSLPLEDQENFMLYQKMLKKDGVVFINVLHTRKPQSDKEGKPKDVTEYDVLGSGSFVQSADINIILNRDKMAEDPRERNTTYVSMPKCRGGITGLACKVYYDPETRQVYDYDDRFGTNTNNSTVLTDEEGEPVVIF